LIKAGGRKIRFEIRELIISILNEEEMPEELKESITLDNKFQKLLCL